MELKTSIGESFLNLFENAISCTVAGTNSALNLHILKIENNQFCYYELIEELAENIISFSLSRRQIAAYKAEGKTAKLYRKAVEKLRENIDKPSDKSSGGETGEILLYSFLESHLNAPKILTKLEIKSSSDDYAKGSDGIHLLKISDKEYQLIFGESKLNPNLRTSLSNAFDSISQFITRDRNNINYEIGLLDSQLCKEVFDETLYEFIKSIVFPTPQSNITRDNAFAIFAGFELNPTEPEMRLPNNDFRKQMRDKIITEVNDKMKYIKEKIEEHKLFGYTFYVYVFPFIHLDETRRKIIDNLIHAKLS
jgi:hypothetical protein